MSAGSFVNRSPADRIFSNAWKITTELNNALSSEKANLPTFLGRQEHLREMTGLYFTHPPSFVNSKGKR
jgi:hypothetical protein